MTKYLRNITHLFIIIIITEVIDKFQTYDNQCLQQ